MPLLHLSQLKVTRCGLLFAGFLLLSQPFFGADWPHFRGPDFNGSSTETQLLADWPQQGPTVSWKVPIGAGFSGIAISGNQLVTMFADGPEEKRQEFVAAFSMKDGSELWRAPLGEEFVNQFGNGPRSTPSISGQRVVVLGSKGNLACFDLSNGKKLWSQDLVSSIEATQTPRFGFSTSPLIDGDRVILDLPGHEAQGYAAFKLSDGSILWREQAAGNGYMSPIRIGLGEQRQYLVLCGPKLSAIDPQGQLVWETEWTAGSVANPLMIDSNRVFVSASGDVGGMLVELDPTQKPVAVKELWRNRSMKNHFNSSVSDGSFIYGFDNATLKCISAEDGQTKWAKRGFGKGSLILADGKLWVLSDRGVLIAVRAQGTSYEELGQSQVLEGKCWTAPSLTNGTLVVRNLSTMAAIKIGRK